ncbi:hypothetical protein J6590_017636 [Homalodisca vitripennis]|nr:hypothetical protein J6590_017636 [Homalodisca vitripennis]
MRKCQTFSSERNRTVKQRPSPENVWRPVENNWKTAFRQAPDVVFPTPVHPPPFRHKHNRDLPTLERLRADQRHDLSMNISNDQPDPDFIKMFVGQIPHTMDENDLTKMFSEFGRVHQINVLRDKITGRSKGKLDSQYFVTRRFSVLYFKSCRYRSLSLLRISSKALNKFVRGKCLCGSHVLVGRSIISCRRRRHPCLSRGGCLFSPTPPPYPPMSYHPQPTPLFIHYSDNESVILHHIFCVDAKLGLGVTPVNYFCPRNSQSIKHQQRNAAPRRCTERTILHVVEVVLAPERSKCTRFVHQSRLALNEHEWLQLGKLCRL